MALAKRKSRTAARNQHYAYDEQFEVEAPKEKVGKNFTVHDIKPLQAKTDKQAQFIKAFFQQVPILIQYGSAGTGKTAVALYCALSEVLDRSTPYDKIIIIRSAVQARDIGFLKGTEKEKNEAYEIAYAGLCDELMIYKSNNYRNLKERGIIEFHNTSFMRGQTWNNTIVIVDECQSATYHELSTAMTRLGTDSKIIFCGDMKQSDLHKKGDVSGLPQLMKVLEKMPEGMVEFVIYTPEDIVRSGLVKEFLLAEEKVA